MNPMMIVGVGVVLAVVGIGVYLANGQSSKSDTAGNIDQKMTATNQPNTATTSSSPAAVTSSDSGQVVDGVRTFTIEAGSFYFKPNEIKVKKGEKVKVVLKSVSMMHDFYIDELGVKSPITKSGDSSTVEFVASKAGTFEYYCSVGEHRKLGQVGKIIVE